MRVFCTAVSQKSIARILDLQANGARSWSERKRSYFVCELGLTIRQALYFRMTVIH